MFCTLIIAIGNVARGDDGAGHQVATRLQARTLPDDVSLLVAVGLDVAMAADVAQCARLLVIEAERRAEPPVEVRPLVAGTAAHSGHAIDGSGLLSVAYALYGATPEATLVSVAAPEMDHGEGLSPVADEAVDEAVEVVLALLGVG